MSESEARSAEGMPGAAGVRRARLRRAGWSSSSARAVPSTALTLRCPRGRSSRFFGPNGAGKTTLLRELALLARPSRGSLRMLGIDALEEPDALRSRIGLISHKSMLYGDLTAQGEPGVLRIALRRDGCARAGAHR